MIVLAINLLFGHALADYPLQGDFLAKGKNINLQFPGMDYKWMLFWHSIIHAGFVLYFTNIYCAIFELIVHMIADHLKCIGKTTFNQDQCFHIICKLAYVGVMIYG